MKSYQDMLRSARRVTQQEPANVKRQRDESSVSQTPVQRTDAVMQIRMGLNQIEKKLDKLTEGIEQSLCQGFREKSLEEKNATSDGGKLLDIMKRIEGKFLKHSELQENLVNNYIQQCSETKKLERHYEEIRMERDVLLEKIHGYLEQISSLKSKVEEQRCSVGAYERQINTEHEINLRKLESINEDLRISVVQKEKQLKDVNDQLKQMQKMLRSYEMLSWRKKNEESVFISILKNDLQTIWNDKMKMEEEFKKLKRICGYIDDDSSWCDCRYENSRLRRSRSLSDITLRDNYVKAQQSRKNISFMPSETSCQNSSNHVNLKSYACSGVPKHNMWLKFSELEKLNGEEKKMNKIRDYP